MIRPNGPGNKVNEAAAWRRQLTALPFTSGEAEVVFGTTR
jgi:hypothetical protein